MTPKLPGLLVRYIQQKRCVVFVGAGLSAGAGLPTWKGLLLKGIEEMVGSLPEGESHQEELRSLVEYGKLLEVAEFCKEKLGAAYHQFLTDQVRGDQAEVPSTHDVLMHLPFSAWVTTNYDKLLERAYSKVMGGFPKTLTHKDTEALGRLLFDGGQFILKAHGDIDRPETVVLTSRDYSEIIHANPAFNEAFTGLLLTKALFFVGYSLSDPDFRLLMDRQLTHFKGFVPERYALMTGVGPVEQDVLWRTARIRIISYENRSGKHAEVLQFLEALKAAVLAMPVPQAGGVKASVAALAAAPAPAAQAPQVRPHNVSSPPSARAPSSGLWAGVLEALSFSTEAEEPPAPAGAKGPAMAPGSPAPSQVAQGPSPAAMRAEMERVAADDAAAVQVAPAYEFGVVEDEAFAAAGDQPISAPSSQPSPPIPQPASTEPYTLFIARERLGEVRLRLACGKELLAEGVASAGLNEVVWLSLKRAGGESVKSHAWLYSHLPRLFGEYLPRAVLAPLEARGGSAAEPLVLHSTANMARLPWELLPLQGQPACLKSKWVRAPVGISSQARGTSQVRSNPRVLLIEGRGWASASGLREIDRLARQYQGAPGISCKVFMGEAATFARVMAELDEALPDLIHYTGDVGQIDGELYLKLPGDMDLSAGALRSVLSRGRLPFLVMNAPSSAFAPYAFEGREGFMDLATQMGVGAFVGAFDMPQEQAGTAFMVALHRGLRIGLPAAEAVLHARKETLKQFPDDPTALQYVLSGDGNLQLWDSKREDTEG